MRRTVRPFIKEFKSRSLKSSAAHPPPNDDADNNDPKPSLLDLVFFQLARTILTTDTRRR